MKSKLFVFIQNRVKMSRKVKTDIELIAIFSKLKESCWLVAHAQMLLLLVRSKRECTTFENPQINLQ